MTHLLLIILVLCSDVNIDYFKTLIFMLNVAVRLCVV